MKKLDLVGENKAFGGFHRQYRHDSITLKCSMRFAMFLPPQMLEGQSVPVLYWLSGLTCTDENFMQKAGALALSARLGIAVVAMDTSPRGEDVPDDEEKEYDFGLGAGFYVNATEEPYRHHYQMYDYVVDELPNLIESEFNVSDRRAISGHSMGGHGALMIALRNPDRYCSATAFSPITNPCECPWGRKAFTRYLGLQRANWALYDTSILLKTADADTMPHILIDQGSADSFLDSQLMPHALTDVVDSRHLPVKFRMQDGYDHSYYFISSFIEDHLAFHARYL